MYDIIGDIHGFSDELLWLLKKLGYRCIGGAWRHPGRKAIFLGDFIDRGPASFMVIDIVRRMIDAGTAHAVMGNHEFNALAYHTPHPDRPGEFLRAHTEKNIKQHKVVLDQLGCASALDRVKWFYTLPLWLDLGELRVVHAYWDEAAMKTLKKKGAVDQENHLKPEALRAASTKGDAIHQAIEHVLKGLEVTLPDGLTYTDKEGNVRSEIRVRWWDAAKRTSWRDIAVGPRDLTQRLPADRGPVPKLKQRYAWWKPPVFVGHYWLSGEPEPLGRNVACVDYSVAKMGGALVAYRWDGERSVKAKNFVTVARRAEDIEPGTEDGWRLAAALNRGVMEEVPTS